MKTAVPGGAQTHRLNPEIVSLSKNRMFSWWRGAQTKQDSHFKEKGSNQSTGTWCAQNLEDRTQHNIKRLFIKSHADKNVQRPKWGSYKSLAKILAIYFQDDILWHLPDKKMLWNSNNSASRSKPGRTRRKTLQESKPIRIGNLINKYLITSLAIHVSHRKLDAFLQIQDVPWRKC